MKRIIITLLLITATFQASAKDWFKDEFTQATYGLHLVSFHNPDKRDGVQYNNGNLGGFIRTKSGLTLGHYYNSHHTTTNYFGWTAPEFYRVSVFLGGMTGYHTYTGRRMMFVVIPSLRVATWSGSELPGWLGVKELSFTITGEPNIKANRIDFGHLMMTARF